MTPEDQIADALSDAFKARVADKSGMSFEETGVSLPPRDIWIYYAKAIACGIRAAENDALERAALVAVDLTDPLGCADRIRTLKHKETT